MSVQQHEIETKGKPTKPSRSHYDRPTLPYWITYAKNGSSSICRNIDRPNIASVYSAYIINKWNLCNCRNTYINRKIWKNLVCSFRKQNLGLILETEITDIILTNGISPAYSWVSVSR